MTSPLLPAYSVDMDKHDLAHLWSVKGRAPFVPMMRAKSRSSRRRFRVSLAVLMVMLFYALRIANEHRSIYLASLNHDIEPPLPKSQVHLVITGPRVDASMCRTILSAAVLNYSTPTILNSGEDFPNVDLPGDGSHLSGLSSLSKYFDRLSKDHDDDIALVVDGSSTWFQLRPDHIIQRYHDLIRPANMRLHHRLGRLPVEAISQSIIFSTQTSCKSDIPKGPACDAVTQPGLPNNLLVPEINVLIADSIKLQQLRRSHSLSTSLIIGPVGSMRTLFSAAHERSSQRKFGVTAQEVLAEMFTEQENHREGLLKQNIPSNWWRMAALLERIGGLGMLCQYRKKPHLASSKLAVDEATSSEFGIGLDYEGLLGSPAPHDADWVKHSSSISRRDLSYLRKFFKRPIARPSLPSSLIYSSKPFPDPSSHPHFPTFVSWNDVPLYTNLHTGNVPAMVQGKSTDASNWERLWWQPYARELLAQRHSAGQDGAPDLKVHIAAAAGGMWWNTLRGYEGLSVDSIATVRVKEICRDVGLEWGPYEKSNVDSDIGEGQNEQGMDEKEDAQSVARKEEVQSVAVRVEEEGFWIEAVEEGEVTWRVVKQPWRREGETEHE